MSRDVLEVIAPGPLTTIQDLGRPGWAHLGISRSGAADRASLRLANRLVGNREDAAALETSLQGPRLRALDDALVVLAGAPCPAQLDGHDVAMHTAVALRAGQELTVGRASSGVRTYVAFAGGLAVAAVLGSRSTDTLGGLGPAPLARGDRLTVLDSHDPPPSVDVVPVPAAEAEIEVTLLLGPREDWFAATAIARLHDTAYRVAAASNRIGVRLEGEALAWTRSEQLRSEGIVPGAVQVPPAGQPIVLMADHPTTGGYPVVGVVGERDLDRIAQLRPGAWLRFRPLAVRL